MSPFALRSMTAAIILAIVSSAVANSVWTADKTTHTDYPSWSPKITNGPKTSGKGRELSRKYVYVICEIRSGECMSFLRIDFYPDHLANFDPKHANPHAGVTILVYSIGLLRYSDAVAAAV